MIDLKPAPPKLVANMASVFWGRRIVGWLVPRLSLTAAVIAVPVFVISRTVGNYGKCKPLIFLDTVPLHDCKYWQTAYVFFAAAGAFGLIALLWNRLGLARIFETPWFGLGEDVENAGLIESVARAVTFVVFLWLALGMAAVATIGVMNIQASIAEGETDPSQRNKDPGNTPHDPTSPAANPLVQQLEKLNKTLEVIDGRLAKLDLNKIQGRSAEEMSREAAELRSVLAQVLKNLETSNGNLTKIDGVLGKSERHLAANEQALAAFEKHFVAYEKDFEHLRTIDRIYDVLASRQQSEQSGECFEYPPASAEVRGVASRGLQGVALARPGRYRTIAVRPIFFDTNSIQLSAWAQQDLLWFLREAPATSRLVAVHGSADPQGTTSNNRRLAQNRAKAIEDFIRANSELRVESEITSAGEGGDPKSEPYKRVAAVRMLVSCPQ